MTPRIDKATKELIRACWAHAKTMEPRADALAGIAEDDQVDAVLAFKSSYTMQIAISLAVNRAKTMSLPGYVPTEIGLAVALGNVVKSLCTSLDSLEGAGFVEDARKVPQIKALIAQRVIGGLVAGGALEDGGGAS